MIGRVESDPDDAGAGGLVRLFEGGVIQHSHPSGVRRVRNTDLGCYRCVRRPRAQQLDPILKDKKPRLAPHCGAVRIRRGLHATGRRPEVVWGVTTTVFS
jgi:hypothetical protein